jgi:OOP family OmpA-OmpF porin
MKKIVLSSIVASSLVFASDYKYEITPMVGYADTKTEVDLKDHSVAGVSVARNLEDKCLDQIELGLLHTIGDADYENSTLDSAVSRIFVNGVKQYQLNDKFNLYALAGLGYERIADEQYNNESDPFFNYGIGIKYAITKTLALKLDARHLLKTDGDRNLLYTFGVGIAFGQKAQKTIKTQEPVIVTKDSDNDGVIDSKDVCPTTVAGIKVDQKGCELDSDNDGVVNSKDICPTTSAGVEVDQKGCAVLNTPEELGVLFETNSATIKSSDLSKFDKYVKYLTQVKAAIIVLEAHTDSIGDENYNLKLSQKRANSVKDQLVKMGIDENRIKAIGYGETKPKVANDTQEHRKQNRRVTARIITK